MQTDATIMLLDPCIGGEPLTDKQRFWIEQAVLGKYGLEVEWEVESEHQTWLTLHPEQRKFVFTDDDYEWLHETLASIIPIESFAMVELEAKLKPFWAEGFTESVDVGPGWTQIVSDCVDALLEADPKTEFLQIKEKFGGLRIYAQPSNWDIIAPFMNEASRTCEETGEPGVLRGDLRWVRVLSDSEYEKAKRREA